MKTAKEITTAITNKKEQERTELINWAIKLIDDASEKMFEKLQASFRIDVDAGYNYKFDSALQQREVKQCLETNGFRVYSKDFIYYLRTE